MSSPEENESIIATYDEVDSLQGDFERLVIDDECSPLAALLRACGQSEGDVSSMASLVRTHVKRGVKKIGEGTYGEAYRGEDGVVMKIVPMGGEALVNGEVQMGPNEIRSETSILKALTKLREHAEDEIEKNFTDGFIRLIDASVCRGPYSKKLLEAWDKYAVTGETENETPGNLPSNQLYISFACEDGGIDLEHFNLRSAKETVALLFQIVVALSVAEEECQFEHRDLHWGNVLIKRVRTKEKVARINGVDINIQTSGLDVAIIDFTLSRLTTSEGDVFCDLNADTELFTGPKGHCQSETYRRMKRVTKGKWSAYNPKTNALWIHYLTDVILEQKDFPISVEEKHELVAFRKRALEYESAGKALFDDLFKGIWTSGKKKQLSVESVSRTSIKLNIATSTLFARRRNSKLDSRSILRTGAPRSFPPHQSSSSTAPPTRCLSPAPASFPKRAPTRSSRARSPLGLSPPTPTRPPPRAFSALTTAPCRRKRPSTSPSSPLSPRRRRI